MIETVCIYIHFTTTCAIDTMSLLMSCFVRSDKRFPAILALCTHRQLDLKEIDYK